MVTDLEKCCMTTQLIQPLHSQARRPLGRYHSRKKTNFPFGFSGVDDSWETSGHNRGAAAEADTIGKQQLKWTQSRSSSLSTQSCLYDFTIASWMLLLLMCVPVRQFMDREDMPITVAINVDLGILVKCRCHMETSTITNLVAISIHITAPLTGTPLLEFIVIPRPEKRWGKNAQYPPFIHYHTKLNTCSMVGGKIIPTVHLIQIYPDSSLVPRLIGGEGREPGIHCLCMCLIATKFHGSWIHHVTFVLR